MGRTIYRKLSTLSTIGLIFTIEFMATRCGSAAHNPFGLSIQEILMQLLHIDSAITGEQSVSRQLTARTVAAWRASHPNTTVQYLDLAAQAPSHLSAQSMGFRTGQPPPRT